MMSDGFKKLFTKSGFFFIFFFSFFFSFEEINMRESLAVEDFKQFSPANERSLIMP